MSTHWSRTRSSRCCLTNSKWGKLLVCCKITEITWNAIFFLSTNLISNVYFWDHCFCLTSAILTRWLVLPNKVCIRQWSACIKWTTRALNWRRLRSRGAMEWIINWVIIILCRIWLRKTKNILLLAYFKVNTARKVRQLRQNRERMIPILMLEKILWAEAHRTLVVDLNDRTVSYSLSRLD